MKVALTGGRSVLGAALAQALAATYEVAVAPEGDLRDEAFARRVVGGAAALIPLAPLYPDLTPDAAQHEVLDRATRGTYLLLNAAVEAGGRPGGLGRPLALFARSPPSL